jgi:hypothetical protein
MRSLDRLLNAESAAELIGVRPSTVRWWWTIGKLHRVKIGRLTRVRESELLTLIHTEEIVPAGNTFGPATGAATPPQPPHLQNDLLGASCRFTPSEQSTRCDGAQPSPSGPSCTNLVHPKRNKFLWLLILTNC